MSLSIFKEIEKGNATAVKRLVTVSPTTAQARTPIENRTPLHVAACLGQLNIVRDLLVHGASFDSVDKEGNTPLHLACQNGNTDVVEELLTGSGRKVLVKAKNKDGQTALHVAAKHDHLEVVVKLVQAGARPDVKDKAGKTAADLVPEDNPALRQACSSLTPVPVVRTVSSGTDTFITPIQPLSTPVRPTSSVGTPGRPLSLRRSTTLDTSSVPAAAPQTVTAKRVDNLDTSFQTLVAQIANMQTQLEGVCQAQLETNGHCQNALSQLTELQNSVHEVESRLVLQETKTRDCRQSVERLEAMLTEQHKLENARVSDALAMQDVQQQLANLTSESEVMRVTLQSCTAQMNQLRSTTSVPASTQLQEAATAVQLQEVKSQLSAFQTLIAALPIAAVQTQTTQISKQLADVTTWVQSQQQQQQAYQEQIRPVVQQLQSITVPSSKVHAIPSEGHKEDTDAQLDVTRSLIQGMGRTVVCLNDQTEQIMSLQHCVKGLQEGLAASVESAGRSQTLTAPSPAPETPRPPIAGSITSVTLTSPTLVWEKLDRAGSPRPGADTAFAAMQSELETLREELLKLKVDAALGQSTLRHEWDKSLNEARQRFMEQTAELQTREKRISSLRESMLMDEAERRARDETAQEVDKRLKAAETGIELLMHKVEVVEEQVSSLTVAMSSGTYPPSPRAQPTKPLGPPQTALQTPSKPSRPEVQRGTRSPPQPVAEAVVSMPSGAPLPLPLGVSLAGFETTEIVNAILPAITMWPEAGPGPRLSWKAKSSVEVAAPRVGEVVLAKRPPISKQGTSHVLSKTASAQPTPRSIVVATREPNVPVADTLLLCHTSLAQSLAQTNDTVADAWQFQTPAISLHDHQLPRDAQQSVHKSAIIAGDVIVPDACMQGPQAGSSLTKQIAGGQVLQNSVTVAMPTPLMPSCEVASTAIRSPSCFLTDDIPWPDKPTVSWGHSRSTEQSLDAGSPVSVLAVSHGGVSPDMMLSVPSMSMLASQPVLRSASSGDDHRSKCGKAQSLPPSNSISGQSSSGEQSQTNSLVSMCPATCPPKSPASMPQSCQPSLSASLGATAVGRFPPGIVRPRRPAPPPPIGVQPFIPKRLQCSSLPLREAGAWVVFESDNVEQATGVLANRRVTTPQLVGPNLSAPATTEIPLTTMVCANNEPRNQMPLANKNLVTLVVQETAQSAVGDVAANMDNSVRDTEGARNAAELSSRVQDNSGKEVGVKKHKQSRFKRFNHRVKKAFQNVFK